MKPQRRLHLRREALNALDAGELAGVVGATHVFTDCGCITHGITCEICPTPSVPVNGCFPSGAYYLSCGIPCPM